MWKMRKNLIQVTNRIFASFCFKDCVQLLEFFPQVEHLDAQISLHLESQQGFSFQS